MAFFIDLIRRILPCLAVVGGACRGIVVGSTCRRATRAWGSHSPAISILSGVHCDRSKPYGEQWSWSRRRKTRRGRRGEKRRRTKTKRRWRERESALYAAVLYSKDRKRKEAGRGAGGLKEWSSGRRELKGREAVKEKRRGGAAAKSEFQDETATRWHGEAGRRLSLFSSLFLPPLHFPKRARSRFKGDFNLCKFIMREHFAVYPWKPPAEIHRRARAPTRRVAARRFSFPDRDGAGKTATAERVNTCRGMVPGLKCSSCYYREDATVVQAVTTRRFRHAWPRKRDAGRLTSGPIPQSIFINFRLADKKKRERRETRRERKRVLARFIATAYSRRFRFNFSLEFVGRDELVVTTVVIALALFSG